MAAVVVVVTWNLLLLHVMRTRLMRMSLLLLLWVERPTTTSLSTRTRRGARGFLSFRGGGRGPSRSSPAPRDHRAPSPKPAGSPSEVSEVEVEMLIFPNASPPLVNTMCYDNAQQKNVVFVL